MADVELNIDGLEKILKALKADKQPYVKVGILGSSPRSGSEGESNASIGARHEFGGAGMPVRSFLRFPLIAMMQKAVEGSGLFDEAALRDMAKTGDVMSIVKKIAIVAEDVVLGAFESGGYGMWPADAPATMKHKKVQMVLVETTQLRGSITSEVML